MADEVKVTQTVTKIRFMGVRWLKPSEIKLIKDEAGKAINPRRASGRMQYTALKESMAEEGLLFPITVMWTFDGYVLLDGDQRLSAAKDLKWDQIPCQVVEGDDLEALPFMLMSDLREPLRPTAVAESVVKLRTEKAVEWPVVRIAKALGRKVNEVELLIQLFSAPVEVRQSVDSYYASEGKIGLSLTAYRALSNQPKAAQVQVADKSAEDKLTVQQVRKATSAGKASNGTVAMEFLEATKDSDILVLVNQLKRQVELTWPTLKSWEQVRVCHSLNELQELIQAHTSPESSENS